MALNSLMIQQNQISLYQQINQSILINIDFRFQYLLNILIMKAPCSVIQAQAEKICVSSDCQLPNPYICHECEEEHEHNGTIVAVKISKIKDIQSKAQRHRTHCRDQISMLTKIKNNFQAFINEWTAGLTGQEKTAQDIDTKLQNFWQNKKQFSNIWEDIKKISKQIQNADKHEAEKLRIKKLSEQINHIFKGEEYTREEGKEAKNSSAFMKSFANLFSYLPVKLTSDPQLEMIKQISELTAENREENKCLGRLLELNGENQKALSIFDKILEQNSLDPEILNRRAILHKNMGKYGEAHEDYSMLISLLEGKMNLTLYYQQRGQINKELGHYEEAIKDLSKVLEGGCVNVHEVEKLMGYCYQKTQKYGKAMQLYERSLKSVSSALYNKNFTLEVLQNMLECAKIMKDHKRTLSMLDSIDMLSPGNVSIYLQRASVCHTLGDYDRAYQTYSSILEKITDNPNVYYNRGVELVCLKRNVEAVEDLKKALNLDPSFKEAANLLANTTFELSSGPERKKYLPIAISDHILCTKLFPNGEGIWHNLGLLYTDIEPAQAYYSFSKAIQINPKQSSSYLGRIKVSLSLTRPPSETLLDIQKVLSLDNKSSYILYLKSVLQQQMGNSEQALQTINQVLAADPERLGGMQFRIQLKKKLNKTEEMEEDLKILQKMDTKRYQAVKKQFEGKKE